MARKAEQTYVGKFQYKGLEPFWLGTLSVPVHTPDHEVQAALMALASTIIPVADLTLILAERGMIVLNLEE